MLLNKWRPPATTQGAAIRPTLCSAILIPSALCILIPLSWFLHTYFDAASFNFYQAPRNVMAVWKFWTSIIVSTTVTSLSSAQPAAGLKVLDLSESSWTVSNRKLNISVPGSLPSVVHLDLFKAGTIGDPYYGLNDFNLRWIGESNWTYATTVSGLNRDIASQSSTWLLFNGLDTFTSINFCGKHVASTNNQFRQYYFDVTGILSNCSGDPSLSINFGSAPLIAKEIAELPGQETWPWTVEGLFEYPHRPFVRKEQSDFGWDWGPAFVPAGPWLPAYVIQNSSDMYAQNNTYVRNTLVDIYRRGQLPLIPPDQNQPWVVNVSLDVVGSLQSGDTISWTLTDSSGRLIQTSQPAVKIVDSTITGFTTVESDIVDLWWPAGMGPQTLYNLLITIVRGNLMTTAAMTKRVGFRTIVLNQEPIRPDQLVKGVAAGSNWHFEINGKEFYAKGSNFIPPDAFWPTVTKARITQLFDSVVRGNQNMLRIWSSGAYSPDFLYDIADEMGILLWSEFEFGDALYPVDKEFLANVREEATYQVRRINHHPSLALWAGGNELENLELGIVADVAPHLYTKYVAEYEMLFLDTLVPCVFENSRSISYTPSSTSKGWLTLNFSLPQPIAQRYGPGNETEGEIYGNTDYYNYNSAFAFNYSSYPVGRFSNEFGYHSMPSLQSWKQAISPADLHFNSSVIQLRNHHYPSGGLNTSNFDNSTKGMGEMTVAAQRWYPTPNKTDPIGNFSSWCHITQVFQADYYKSQIQFYRRGSGMPERQLGSLYWQLNDIWQAPTWAGIEYDGRWKVLHYTAKDIYSHVIISPFYNTTTGILQIYVTSDLWSTVTGTASFTWFDWSGNLLNIALPRSTSFTVGAINTTLVLETNTTSLLSVYNAEDVVLLLEVDAQGKRPNSEVTEPFHHENWFHPTPLSKARLVDPGLTTTFFDADGSSAARVEIEAVRGVAAWVWLDYRGADVVHLEDNGFWLRKGRKRVVTVSGMKEGWAAKIGVESLWNMTQP